MALWPGTRRESSHPAPRVRPSGPDPHTTPDLLSQIVGIMAACERFLTDAEDRNAEFPTRLFQRQIQRLTMTLDAFIVRRSPSSLCPSIHLELLADFVLSTPADESS